MEINVGLWAQGSDLTRTLKQRLGPLCKAECKSGEHASFALLGGRVDHYSDQASLKSLQLRTIIQWILKILHDPKYPKP